MNNHKITEENEMIKFETINGTLCRMVEPTPLQLDSEFPCAVRLIQDDSPMGLCNRWKYSEKQDLLKKDWNISSLENNLNKVKDIHYSQFEIIGYPVAEGSAEWALYQMMQGEKICHHKSPSIVYCKHAGDISRQVRYNCVDYMSASAWLNGADKNGWQLYKEPEPQYKVGDWVEYRLDGDTYYGKICNIRGYVYYLSVTTEEIPKDQARAIMLERIIRKIFPREVIVHIGCLSGTVRPVSTNGIHIWFHLIGVDDKTIAIIRISCLDTETRELVEGLLKAQEEAQE